MRFIICFSLYIKLVTLQTLKVCSFNEVCVNIKNCSAYKDYGALGFRYWPADLQKMAKDNLCNNEMIDNELVLSVCCQTVMNPKNCGVQAGDRISNGVEAKVFEFPWMALLQIRSGKFVCGGTLVSRRFVLTAAHCIKDAEVLKIVSVRLGENDIRNTTDCNILDNEADCAPEPQDIKVDQRLRHLSHSDRTKKNDIALLRLERLADLGDSVRPICLPNGTPEQRMVDPSFLVVSGWGQTENGNAFDVLRYARVPPLSQEECAPKLRMLDPVLQLDGSQICAGGVEKIDNCAGDSGGPLQYISNKTSRYIQYGIVSYGLKSCGVQSEPGVYTNVIHYIEWILGHVNE